jgi:hypothetical protein
MSSTAIELITQLDFVSRIEIGFKVNVKSNSIIEAASSYGSVSRYIFGESRQETINFINHVITRVIEITPKEDPNTQLCLVDSLRKSIEGINNLKITYEKDIFYVAKLSSEIIRIEHFIKWISEHSQIDNDSRHK